MSSGGCITRQWGAHFEVNERVLDLLNDEPDLMREFERLYQMHDQKLPRFLRFGARHLTSRTVPGRGRANILTSCTRHRGLQSSCWFVPSRR